TIVLMFDYCLYAYSTNLLLLVSFPTRRSSDLFMLMAGTAGFFAYNTTETRKREAAAKEEEATAAKAAVPVAEEPIAKSLAIDTRSEEHTSELQSREKHVCRLLHKKKNLPDSKK